VRIVHVTNYFQPEMGYQEHYLAKHQVELGHEVHVITSNRAYPPQPDYAVLGSLYPSRKIEVGVERRDGYVVHRLSARFERNMQLVLARLIREIRSLSPDLVIAHGFSRYETLRLAMYKRIFRPSFRLVVDDHSLLSTYEPARYRRIYHSLVRGAFRFLRPAFDRIVPVSGETWEFLTSRFGVPPASMTILPLGTDVDLFTFDAAARSRTRAALGIPDDAVVIIFVGKSTKERALHLLYEASESTLLRNPSCFLLIVGSGHDSPYAKELRRRAELQSLTNQVLWHNHVPHEELPGFFSAADIAVWLLPSLGTLEASACGLPVVLLDSGVARERTAGANGITCKSSEDLEKTIAMLVANGQLRADMGERGARFIREQFDWKKISEAFTKLGSVAGEQ
jgi:glycosyltransferase involved in cell wall biosynthesis